jgi:hypothetical protein
VWTASTPDRSGDRSRRPRAALGAFAAVVALAALAAPGAGLRVAPWVWTPGPGSAQPSLTATREGGFALTWQQKQGAGAELRLARFDASRGDTVRLSVASSVPSAQVAIARGDDWFVNWADFPSLAVLDNGDWVTFTLRQSTGSTYAYDIHLQRSVDGGATWQAPVKVNNDGQPVQHGFVSLLPDGDDRVLMVWLDGRQDAVHGGHGGATGGHGADDHGHGERMSLRSAVVGRDGVAREEATLDADTCSCCQTDLVRRGGVAVAVYRDHAEGIRDIAMLRRSSRGPWSASTTVHDDAWRMPGCPVNGPAAAVNRDALAVLWPTMARGPLEVKLAISPREGAAFGAPVLLESGASVLGRVDLAPWRNGGFLASWVGGDARGAVLRLAALDAAGRVLARRDVVALPPGRQLGHPRVASTGDGTAMLAWTEPTPQGPRVRLARIDAVE